MIKVMLIIFFILILSFILGAIIYVCVKALRMISPKHKCKYCSSTMRMFCESKPNECHGPHNW